MDYIKNKEVTEASLNEVLTAIWDLLNKNSEIESTETLKAQSIWTRKIHRQQVQFNFTRGQADKAALYCQNGYHPFNQSNISEFSIPAEFGKCTLMLQSEQLATFTFKESGELVYKKPTDMLTDG